jgi:hypothetical protein
VSHEWWAQWWAHSSTLLRQDWIHLARDQNGTERLQRLTAATRGHQQTGGFSAIEKYVSDLSQVVKLEPDMSALQ